MNLVKKVPILKDLPPIVTAGMVPCLRQEVFLPNDIIVKAGTIGDCMYFIHCGTVAVYTPTGKEVILDFGYLFGFITSILYYPHILLFKYLLYIVHTFRSVIYKTAVILEKWVLSQKIRRG